MSQPVVTIAALCYNNSRYVIETLESIKAQTYPYVEVLLVDDCSTDHSVEVIQDWLRQHHIHYWQLIRHSANQGVTKTLNEVIGKASGKYFKAIACDDILLPEYTAYMVHQFEQLTDDYALLYSDVQTIDEHATPFGTSPFTERGWNKEAAIPSGDIFDQLADWCFIPAVSTIMRTSVVQQLQFSEYLKVEDWDMWLKIAKQYKIKGLNVQFCQYRIHSASVYQQKSPTYQDHELQTVKQHMGHSLVADKKIKDFIYERSIRLYMNGGDRAAYWLWQRFLIKKTIPNAVNFLMALLGIRYEKRLKWKQQLQQK